MFDHAILIMIHCDQFTGYAVGVLESVFADAALQAGYADNQIFWSYAKVTQADHKKIIECQFQAGGDYTPVATFIKANNIKQVLAFDLPYPADILPVLRRSGVKHILSYWGASMSSLNTGVKLWLKKTEWWIRRYKPDAFVFESDAMQLTATQGRGVPASVTSVIPLGVDLQKFYPAYGQYFYAHEQLSIPRERKLVFYSGHMEERKGVRVIMHAAIELVQNMGQSHIHFVICGNKNNEAERYQAIIADTPAAGHVTFAGYRGDIPELMRSSSIGVIASTGWDSFTMSSVEMMASGLPMIVSRLQGLGETIAANENGYHIEPGDSQALAAYIKSIVADTALAERFSAASRARAAALYSRNRQVEFMAVAIKQGGSQC